MRVKRIFQVFEEIIKSNIIPQEIEDFLKYTLKEYHNFPINFFNMNEFALMSNSSVKIGTKILLFLLSKIVCSNIFNINPNSIELSENSKE